MPPSFSLCRACLVLVFRHHLVNKLAYQHQIDTPALLFILVAAVADIQVFANRCQFFFRLFFKVRFEPFAKANSGVAMPGKSLSPVGKTRALLLDIVKNIRAF